MKKKSNIRQTIDGLKYSIVNFDNINEIPSLLKNDSSIKGLSISLQNGYKEQNLSILKEVSHIEWLTFIDEYGDIVDVSEIYRLSNLKYLQFSSPRELDFSNFGKLIKLSALWPKDQQLLKKCASLKHLYLRKGKKDNYLDEISELNLESIELTQCQLDSLHGLSKTRNLRSLELSYCPKLLDISEIKLAKKIERLFFENCKNIECFSPISNLINLKTLSISHCKSINSLDFLEQLHELQILTFFGTQVSSNNLSPIKLCHNIRELGFNNKKGYNFTLDELKRYINNIGD